MPIIFFSGVKVWVGVGVGVGFGMGVGDRRITLSSIDVRFCVLCMRNEYKKHKNKYILQTRLTASI